MKRQGDVGDDGDRNGRTSEAGTIFENAEEEGGGGGDVLVMAAQDPEQWPHVILRGTSAGLSALRQLGTEAAQSTFFVGPRELLHGKAVPCRIQWQDGVSSSLSSIGTIYIVASQVLFVSADGTSASMQRALADQTSPQEEDWAIGATCIHLHAMTDEPETSVYLQLHEEASDEDSTLEVTLIPFDPASCQELFDGLCKLVSRHPLQLDDDENDGPGFGGGGGGNFFMGGGGEGEDMVWAPSSSAGCGAAIPDDDDEDGDGDGGATEAERAAMLERLDNMLVVRPQLEVQVGQFDDAEEQEDDDEDGQPMIPQ